VIHISDIIAVPAHAPICRDILDDEPLGTRAAWAFAVENPINTRVMSRIWRMRNDDAKPRQGTLL